MSRWLRAAATTVFVAAAALPVACGWAERRERWVADSTAYAVNLQKWLHDSAVVDSIARTVDITELVSAYTKLVTAAQPLDELPNVSCATTRVFWDYGDLAADVAAERARDSVVRLFGEKAFAQAAARAPGGSSTEMLHYSKCRGKEATHRKMLGTTPLDSRDPRPRPPRRWLR